MKEKIILYARISIEGLGCGIDGLMRHYAAIIPGALNLVPPEKKHRIYKMFGAKVPAWSNGSVQVGLVCPDSVRKADLCL